MTDLPTPSQEPDQIFDGDDPYSIFNLLQDAAEIVAAIKALPHHLLGQSERELRRGFKPDTMNERLKIAFWDEYRRAQAEAQRTGRGRMVIRNVIHGLCSRNWFYIKVREDRLFLAWIINPPPDELIVQKELLQLGYKRMREVLTHPIADIKRNAAGKIVERKINVALVKEIRSITEMLQNRIHGSVIQKQQIEAKTLSVNLRGNPDGLPPKKDPDMAEIEGMLEQLKKIEKKATKLLPKEAEIIEGEVTDGT